VRFHQELRNPATRVSKALCHHRLIAVLTSERMKRRLKPVHAMRLFNRVRISRCSAIEVLSRLSASRRHHHNRFASWRTGEIKHPNFFKYPLSPSRTGSAGGCVVAIPPVYEEEVCRTLF
jgi:hypothetical protein